MFGEKASGNLCPECTNKGNTKSKPLSANAEKKNNRNDPFS